MKLLFETVSGKKVLKEFKNGTLAKNFIEKNKDKINSVKIMEDKGEYNKFSPDRTYGVKPEYRNRMGMKYHPSENDLGNKFSSAFDKLNDILRRLEYGSPEFEELKGIIRQLASFKKKVIYSSDNIATDVFNPNDRENKEQKKSKWTYHSWNK